jgi:hypothetical protein
MELVGVPLAYDDGLTHTGLKVTEGVQKVGWTNGDVFVTLQSKLHSRLGLS